MMWLNSKLSDGHRSFLLKQLLFFSVILCFLIAFNLSFAEELTDPGSTDSEHPWDEVCEHDGDRDPPDPREIDNVLMIKFGFGPWVIIHMQSAEQKDGFGTEKAFRPVEKNRGHLLILIK